MVFLSWLAAAGTSVNQKMKTDRMIRDSFDISAIQIQQLNGSVTSHVLVALTCALAVSMVFAAGFACWVRSSRGS